MKSGLYESMNPGKSILTQKSFVSQVQSAKYYKDNPQAVNVIHYFT